MKCRLCLQENEIIQSHILPEYLYAPLYPKNKDKPKRFYAISNDPTVRKEYEQKGYREELLCHECDNKLIGKHEKYAKEVLKKIKYKIKNKLVINILKIEDVDYNSFKLFQLSILWRSSISSLEEFKNITLSQIDNENLRQMLLSQNPGNSKTYGCQIIYPICENEIIKRMIIPQLIIPPELTNFNGYDAYRVFFSGLFWMFFIIDEADDIFKEIFISQEGLLPVFKIKGYAEDYLHKYAIEMGIANRKRDGKE